MDLNAFLNLGRAYFAAGNRHSTAERKALLAKLEIQLRNRREAAVSALLCDLHKSEFESTVTEYLPALRMLRNNRRRLGFRSMKRRAVTAFWNWPGRSYVQPEPYGMVLVSGTWNYPLLLALEPLAGAIAAGNHVVLKLSEQSPATAHFVADLIAGCGCENEIFVVPPSVPLSRVLDEKFDYIFFTGGPEGGRYTTRRAAEHLTPVTLELGGKNPCIVDADADLRVAARRIVWGKFLNAGQTCAAPDYLLAHRSIKNELLNALRAEIRRRYGEDPEESPYFGRIVNDEHFERLRKLLERGRLAAGGETDRQQRYIAPTVIDNISWDDPVMREEIFGPILPVLEFESLPVAIAAVNAHEKPLALYYFGKSAGARKTVRSTSSGTVAVNDTVMQFANPSLPFGGVGQSGMGRYHGKYTFETFSHGKPVLKKSVWGELPLRYPPLAAWLRKLLRILR